MLQTLRSGLCLLGVVGLLSADAMAQSSSSPASGQVQSSSSSSSTTPEKQAADTVNPANRPRAAQIERGGAAVTLEVSEPLFDLAAALNACGYDADLDKSAPVRAKVRAEMNTALAGSETARDSRDKMCAYINQHRLNDLGLDVGQYVSLALYLSPPPELTPNVDLTELPPQAAAVVNVLPLLRTFADEIQLHYIWLQHRAEYEGFVDRIHNPMTKMVLDTNLYLHLPVSSYEGRRFLVLLLAGFAAFALILASLGIYAVISFSVSQRVQEIGIRMALGASASDLQRRIVLRTLGLAAVGLALGMAGSRVLSSALGSRKPCSTRVRLRDASPSYIAPICGTVTCDSSMTTRKSSGK